MPRAFAGAVYQRRRLVADWFNTGAARVAQFSHAEPGGQSWLAHVRPLAARRDQFIAVWLLYPGRFGRGALDAGEVGTDAPGPTAARNSWSRGMEPGSHAGSCGHFARAGDRLRESRHALLRGHPAVPGLPGGGDAGD